MAVVSDLSSQKLATAISHVTVFDAIGQHVKQLLDGWRLVFAHNFFLNWNKLVKLTQNQPSVKLGSAWTELAGLAMVKTQQARSTNLKALTLN